VDLTTGLAYGMDMTPLIADATLDPGAYVEALIRSFAQDVATRLKRMS
jgi:hypothetical protein